MDTRASCYQIPGAILIVLFWWVWLSYPLRAQAILPANHSPRSEQTVQDTATITATVLIEPRALFSASTEAPFAPAVLQAAKNKLYLPFIAVSPTWRQIGADGRDINAIDLSNNRLYLADRANDDSGGVYFIDDCDGATLQKSTLSKARTFDVALQSKRGLALAFDATTFYTTDRGDEWSTASGNLQGGAYAITFGEGDLAYAGSDGGVYRSVNQGESWTDFSQQIPNLRFVNKVWYDTAAHELWVGTNQAGVWRWQNENEGFKQLIVGLDSDQARDVWSIQRTTIATTTYTWIGTSNGVYMRTGSDDSQSWSAVGGTNSALNGRRIYSLAVDDQGILYAGAAGAGLWRITIAEILQATNWQSIEGGGWSTNTTVRDLIWNPAICQGLVAATIDGVWVYR